MRIPQTLVLFITLLFCATTRAQNYPIKLERPAKVGDKMRVEGTGRLSIITSADSGSNAVPTSYSDFTAEYDVVETTLEVGEHNRITKSSIQVNKLTKTEDKKTEEVVPKDKVIVVSQSEKGTVFEIDGVRVSPAVARVLTVFITKGADYSTDDEIFGTKERQKRGEAWPANGQPVEAEMRARAAENPAAMTAEDMNGTVKLVSVDKGPDGEVAKISMYLGGPVNVPLPPDYTLRGAAIEWTYECELPVNPEKPRLAQSVRKVSQYQALRQGPQGQRALIKSSTEWIRKLKWTPVK
jgi:hypothetical protein